MAKKSNNVNINGGVFDVKIELSPALMGLLAIRVPEVEKVARAAINEAAEEAVDLIKADTPVRTGTLRNAIKMKPARVHKNGLPQAEIYADLDEAPYAAIVEFGGKTRNYKGAHMFEKNIGAMGRLVRHKLTRSLNAYLQKKSR